MKLSAEECKEVKPLALLSQQEAQTLASELPEWMLSDKEIEREFKFDDFRQAMQFVNRAAEIANAQDHHPDIFIFYNRVRLIFSTHKVGGLSRNDFITAAKIDLIQAATAGLPSGCH